jgi:hypothetical protein
MKAVRIVVPFLILGLTLPTSIGSSDFSQLAEPAFARSLMITPERHIELRCAALAYLPYRKFEVFDVADEPEYMDEPTDEMIEGAEGRLSQYPYSEKMAAPNISDAPPSKYEPIVAPPFAVDLGGLPEKQFEYDKILSEAEAERLKAAVVSRLISDTGDDKMAQQSFDHRFSEFEVPYWDASEVITAERKSRRETAAHSCAAMFDAARTNTLEANLSPASAEPIALMTVDTCLAYDLIAQKSPDYNTYSILADNRRDETYAMLVGPKGRARKAREKTIAAVAASMGEVDPQFAVTKSIPCLATYIIEMKKNPEFWEATE